MADTHLEIVIDGDKGTVTYEGDVTKIVKILVKLAKEDDEFALAYNVGAFMLRDHLNAIRLRDEMIGFINPQK